MRTSEVLIGSTIGCPTSSSPCPESNARYDDHRPTLATRGVVGRTLSPPSQVRPDTSCRSDDQVSHAGPPIWMLPPVAPRQGFSMTCPMTIGRPSGVRFLGPNKSL